MSHELVRFPNGTASLKPLAGREAMHSSIGPWLEANQVYVEQAGLSDRLKQPGRPLVLFDVGMGIAANAIAAIVCAEKTKTPVRRFQIISFENDLDGIIQALRNTDQFPYLKGP